MADISISFSKRQFADLVKALELAHELSASLDEDYNSYEILHRRFDDLSGTVLAAGVKGESSAVEEIEGEPTVSDDIFRYVEKAMDDYDESLFWEELKRRLAERDLTSSLTPIERRKILSEGEIPARARKLYEDYESEFKRHGVSRLRVAGNRQ